MTQPDTQRRYSGHHQGGQLACILAPPAGAEAAGGFWGTCITPRRPETPDEQYDQKIWSLSFEHTMKICNRQPTRQPLTFVLTGPVPEMEV